jgi:hypothetical protein
MKLDQSIISDSHNARKTQTTLITIRTVPAHAVQNQQKLAQCLPRYAMLLLMPTAKRRVTESEMRALLVKNKILEVRA